MIVSLNGQLLDSDQAKISIWDGGFLYGDGIFTTLRLYKGIPVDLAAHWERLRDQAEALNLPFPLELQNLRSIIASLAKSNDLPFGDGRIRITISRGGSFHDPLPLKGLKGIKPTILVTLAPLSANLTQWQSEGIPVITLGTAFSRGNVPELKTLNTLPSILAQRMAAAAGCPEAILTGPDGVLLEGAASNLFLVISGKLFTPAPGAGFLAGLTREKILAIAKATGLGICEQDLFPSHLEKACEIFVVGSIREVVPVVIVDGKKIGDGAPGPVTLKIQHEYHKMIETLLAD